MDETLEDADFQRQAEFRYAIRRFSRFSEDQAREAGITPQQHLLLLTVRGHQHYPQVTIKDVAERLQVRHHSASLLIDRSIARGLLVKSEDAADKRKAIVTLTPEGQSLLDQITRANRRVLRMLMRLFLACVTLSSRRLVSRTTRSRTCGRPAML